MTRLAGALLAAFLLTFAPACGPGGGTGGPTPPRDGVPVRVTVTGPGRVVQEGFTCAGDCGWTVPSDRPATFSAQPAAGHVLVSWGGACPALQASCTARFEEGDAIEATFAPHAVRLDLAGDGSGRFRIAGGDVEATCNGDCGVALDRPLQLAITYEAAGTTGTVLDAWTGACAGAPRDDYCLVSASGVTAVGKTLRHPPVAIADGYATFRNGELNVGAADGVLANDVDTPGDPLVASLVGDATNGALTLAPNGGFDYLPADGFDGQDGFRYRVTDAFGNTAEAAVTIAVVDRVPAAADDAYATSRNATLTVDPPGVLDNDADPDGDPLSAVLEDDVSSGTLTLRSDGGFTFVAGDPFVPTETFTYRASDGADTGNLATVTLSITNDPPEAAADAYGTAMNTTLSVSVADGLLSNDSDADGDALTATLADGVTDGTLTFAPDGSFAYVPDDDFAGTDGFTYVAGDGVAESSPTTVTIVVTNDAPIATDDAYSVVHDTTLTVSAPGLLDDDTDPNGDPLSAALATDVNNGALALTADGSFEYAPDPGFVGTDAFTYVASDGAAVSGPATVTITVTNAAPVGTADGYGVAEDDTLTVTTANGVLDNDSDADGDALTATLVDDVTNGTLILDADGSFTYAPDPGYTGVDGFTYQASDGIATSATTSVTISVDPASPTAIDDSYATLHDTTLTVEATNGVLDNDSDPNGDPLTATLVDDVTNGTLILDADGSFTYAPDPGFVGTDAFGYDATDGTYTSGTATVSISVTNQAPAASPDSYVASQDATLSVSAADGVLDNDSDADGDALTAALDGDVTNGALTLDADGSFEYTPNAGYTGPDSFTYTAADGIATSAATTVTLDVQPAAPYRPAGLDPRARGSRSVARRAGGTLRALGPARPTVAVPALRTARPPLALGTLRPRGARGTRGALRSGGSDRTRRTRTVEGVPGAVVVHVLARILRPVAVEIPAGQAVVARGAWRSDRPLRSFRSVRTGLALRSYGTGGTARALGAGGAGGTRGTRRTLLPRRTGRTSRTLATALATGALGSGRACLAGRSPRTRRPLQRARLERPPQLAHVALQPRHGLGDRRLRTRRARLQNVQHARHQQCGLVAAENLVPPELALREGLRHAQRRHARRGVRRPVVRGHVRERRARRHADVRFGTDGAGVDRREQTPDQHRGLVAGQRVLGKEGAVGESGLETRRGQIVDRLDTPVLRRRDGKRCACERGGEREQRTADRATRPDSSIGQTHGRITSNAA
jgi:hypothetical protein